MRTDRKCTGGYPQGSVGSAAATVVDGAAVAGSVDTGAPGTVDAVGAVVVVEGTVMVPLNDEPSTTVTASLAVGSGTSLASGK